MAQTLMKNSAFRLTDGAGLPWIQRSRIMSLEKGDDHVRSRRCSFCSDYCPGDLGGAYALDKHLLEAVRQLPR